MVLKGSDSLDPAQTAVHGPGWCAPVQSPPRRTGQLQKGKRNVSVRECMVLSRIYS